MAAIPNIGVYNFNRKELVKYKKAIEDAAEETVVMTKDEIGETIRELLVKECDWFGAKYSTDRKIEIANSINGKLTSFESEMVEFINNKIDKITETIIDRLVSHKINLEVERRLEEKIEEIRKSL